MSSDSIALRRVMRIEALLYCKLDEDLEMSNDSRTFDTCFQSAINYLDGAGIPFPAPETSSDRVAQYQMCLNVLTLDAWDRRAATISGSVSENPSFRRMLNQLKLTAYPIKPKADIEYGDVICMSTQEN